MASKSANIQAAIEDISAKIAKLTFRKEQLERQLKSQLERDARLKALIDEQIAKKKNKQTVSKGEESTNDSTASVISGVDQVVVDSNPLGQSKLFVSEEERDAAFVKLKEELAIDRKPSAAEVKAAIEFTDIELLRMVGMVRIRKFFSKHTDIVNLCAERLREESA